MDGHTDWPELVNSKYISFQHQFSRTEVGYELYINGRVVIFPKVTIDWTVSPDKWLEGKHESNKVHEPGMISWLLAFSDVFANKQIIVYDIGALYGYFSALSSVIFNNVNVVTVEGNPISAHYIQEMVALNRFSNIDIKNVLVGEEERDHEFVIKTFDYFEVRNSFALFAKNLYNYHLKNAVKYIINSATGTHKYKLMKPLKMNLHEVPLCNILHSPIGQELEIFKFDTEGYQAKYLPPCTETLIDRNAIILMEFDEAKKLQRFGQTNKTLCQPFLDAGYSLYWSNHRKENQNIQRIGQVTEKHERNSLGVLIPKIYS